MILPVLVCWSVRHLRRPGEGPAGVQDVTLEVHGGEVACVVGPRRAGKTTLLALAAGRMLPQRGSVRVAGIAPDGPAARSLVGYLPPTAALPAWLSVRDCLAYLAALHGRGIAVGKLVAEAIEATGLRDVAGRRVGQLTAAEVRRLGLAQAALGGRRLLVLDEPFAGLDPADQAGLAYAIQRLSGAGAAVLLAAADPTGLERLVDRVFVLNEGRLVRSAPAAAILGQRVLEVRLDQPPHAAPAGFRVTATGMEIDLGRSTPEAVLALCRSHRLAVRASRVRLKSLEEVTFEAVATRQR